MKVFSSSRRWTAITGIISALMLAAVPVAAENWGANGYADGGPPPGGVACDITQDSECIADGGTHYVYFDNVDDPQHNATKGRMTDVYNPLLGVHMVEVFGLYSYTDVIVYRCDRQGWPLRHQRVRWLDAVHL